VEIKGWVALLDILGSGLWGQMFLLLIFVGLRSRWVRGLWVRSLFDVLLREQNELLCGLDLLLEIDLLPAQFFVCPIKNDSLVFTGQLDFEQY
jgi:hypothetical protein